MLPVNPSKAVAEFNAALALIRQGRLAEAQTILRRLHGSVAGRAEISFQLARVTMALGDAEGACKLLDEAERLRPQEPSILAARIEAEEKSGHAEAALAAHDRMIRLRPKEVKPLADKAVYLQQLGRFDEARATLDRALKKAPNDGELFRIYVTTYKVTPGDPILARMRKAHQDPAVTGFKRAHLDFAMAKALEDVGDHGQVFRHLDAANRAIRAQQPWDRAARRAEVDRVLAAFRGQSFRFEPGDSAGLRPIFVTGMPRSGTTLVEAILGRHPAVTTAGEVGYATRLAERLIHAADGTPIPLDRIPAAALADFARDYERQIRGAVAPDRWVTDKSMQSWMYMGLIRMAIPGARIVVVHRDPRDMLLSIYRNVFPAGLHRYAYDMEDLASYYADFRKVVAFWRDACPGAFVEMRYEDLVADPDAESRRLVDAVGLDWDPGVLDPARTEGRIRTLSLHQARQPIYSTSAQGWRKYEAELAPLLDALKREGVAPE